MDALSLDVGLDQALRAHIEQHFISEGRLYAAVLQTSLTADERMALLRAGWTARNFVDAPIMEPPMLDVRWHDLKERHRDRTLHRIHHRFPEDTPWAGNRLAILEELLSSIWDDQEDELRILLAAWTYASVWNEPPHESASAQLEAMQTFFFYSERMRNSMVQILEEGTTPPDEQHEFWSMLDVLVSHGGSTP